MLTYSTGSVFNAGTQTIVNTVNCEGVMGAGIALESRLRFPQMFEDYKIKCQNHKIKVGHVDYFRLNDKEIIVNFPTKKYFRYPSEIAWIESGLVDFVKTYKMHGVSSIAFSKLGTNNGELKWDEVQQIMEKHLNNLDIEVVICLDTDEFAEGKEKEMVDRFNSASMDILETIVKMNKNIHKSFSEGRPIKRFREILQLDSVGLTTYKKLFEYFFVGKPEISRIVNQQKFDL